MFRVRYGFRPPQPRRFEQPASGARWCIQRPAGPSRLLRRRRPTPPQSTESAPFLCLLAGRFLGRPPPPVFWNQWVFHSVRAPHGEARRAGHQVGHGAHRRRGLGLPLDEMQQSGRSGPGEEAGPRVLDLLARLDFPPPTVVVKGPRSGRDNTREIAAALRSGAFAVVDRTGLDVEQMLEVLRRCLHPLSITGRWPGTGGGSGGGWRGAAILRRVRRGLWPGHPQASLVRMMRLVGVVGGKYS